MQKNLESSKSAESKLSDENKSSDKENKSSSLDTDLPFEMPSIFDDVD
jgi:hypothetical protein